MQLFLHLISLPAGKVMCRKKIIKSLRDLFWGAFQFLDNLSMSSVMPRSLLCVKDCTFSDVSSRESTSLLLLNEPLPVCLLNSY